MQAVSTRRFSLIPLVAALAIAVSVGIGIGFIAFDGSDTVPAQSQSVQREPDIHSILVRDTGGPWVSPGNTNDVWLPVDTKKVTAHPPGAFDY